MDELVKQYEALWENDAPMEQIVDFCRRYSQKLMEDERGEMPLINILCQSDKWGEMVLMPAFLKHLTDNDDSLLCVIGSYYLHGGHKSYIFYRILSMKKGISDRIRAFFGVMILKKQTFWIKQNDSLGLVDNDDIT